MLVFFKFSTKRNFNKNGKSSGIELFKFSSMLQTTGKTDLSKKLIHSSFTITIEPFDKSFKLFHQYFVRNICLLYRLRTIGFVRMIYRMKKKKTTNQIQFRNELFKKHTSLYLKEKLTIQVTEF